MLTYSIKINDNNLEMKEVVWGEKYLSPDHSFVSGVTSQDYHLERQTQIVASISGKTNILNIECENVVRQGYVVIKGKKYKLQTANTYKYGNESGSGTTRYIEVNGVYYYVNNGSVIIPNWLTERYSIRKKIVNKNLNEKEEKKYYVPGTTTKTVTGTVTGDYVKLDTIIWIENGRVNIDGNYYIFDPDETFGGSKGGLKYTEDGVCLPATGITDCDSISYVTIPDACDFKPVTKFKLTTTEDLEVRKDNISYCTFFFFIKYNENYYPIEISGSNYICKINGTSYNLKFEYTGENVTTSEIKTYEDLYYISAYIEIGGGCHLYMDKILQNSNYGKKIGIYLTNGSENIKTGDIISLRRVTNYDEEIEVETDSLGDKFIIHNNVKYQIVSGMMNTVLINNQEYNIIRNEGGDCIVDINGEEVPMKKNGNTLKRYGLIVKDERLPKEATYDIKTYSGVTIEGKNYRVVKSDDGSGIDVISAEPGIVYRVIVEETVGSSLLICKPYFNRVEFSENAIDEFTDLVNNDIVTNQDEFFVYTPNYLFGSRETMPTNGKLGKSTPNSSNDFEDVLGELALYSNNGYIRIPLKLDIKAASDQLLDNIIQRDFSEAERKKAINDIVDMERDIYTPKYIENSIESINAYKRAGGTGTTASLRNAYIGAFTDFKPVYTININPHFRTRNMDNWKVIESYNYKDEEKTSGVTDNWFITDYEPYKTILNSSTDDRDLSTVSDLLGLLYFTNMDVFYQKSALEKSFIRLSYFDDTNQQTQSMLHSSTVFFDEHKSFKTYIDNSRKNVYDYMMISAPKKEGEDEYPDILNRISVYSEFIGKYDSRKRKTHGDYGFIDAKVEKEDKRLSSRFIISNKYETDNSSEGFYLYVFKEYSENLHPKPIYMKIEFNHAGVGKTIPFLVPMKWENRDKTSPYVYPTSKLSLKKKADLKIMQDGIPLSWIYGQGYVPLYIMYDFKNKEYVYVFDDRYITNENGNISLNVFELKAMNDEDPKSNYRVAKININDNQIKVK